MRESRSQSADGPREVASSSDIAVYARLMRLARPYWPHIGALLLLNLLAPPLALLTPLPLKIAVDCALGSQPVPAPLDWLLAGGPASFSAVLWLSAGLLIAIALLVQFQDSLATVLHAYTGERLTLHFRAMLFGHAQRLSLLHHDVRGTSDSTFRIQYDTPSIQWIAVDGLIPILTAAIQLAAMIYITARIDWQIALVALAISPPLLAISHVYKSRMKTQYESLKDLEGRAFNVVHEVLAAVRVVKAFGREDDEQQRFVHRSRESLRARMAAAASEGFLSLANNLIIAVGTAVVLLLGITKVHSGTLSLGNLLLVMAYLAQLYSPLKTLSKTVGTLEGSLASARRAFELLDQSPEVTEHPDARALQRAVGAVEFRGVSFSYDGRHSALRDISFAVSPGARVGIAGRTGAGKTTLLSLVMRFYDCAGGQILLDGTDLREYRLTDLRRQFAMVLQEPVLFSSSIAENIAYARPGASDEEIIAAANAADAHDFIKRLPDGYRTLVGERGMRLSGGERQRISLARAFLKDAPILILDEPTSSVDTKTEAAIMEAMDRLMKGRTSFVIAHRLSTLEGCDVRLELEQGCLVSAPTSLNKVTSPPEQITKRGARDSQSVVAPSPDAEPCEA